VGYLGNRPIAGEVCI
jgi:glutamine---fructose-6-phosphate transaminase (isomerizing)